MTQSKGDPVRHDLHGRLQDRLTLFARKRPVAAFLCSCLALAILLTIEVYSAAIPFLGSLKWIAMLLLTSFARRSKLGYPRCP
jgi:hypothetical protein